MNSMKYTTFEALELECDSLRQQLAEANEPIEYMLSRDKAWADIDSLKEQQLAATADPSLPEKKGNWNPGFTGAES